MNIRSLMMSDVMIRSYMHRKSILLRLPIKQAPKHYNDIKGPEWFPTTYYGAIHKNEIYGIYSENEEWSLKSPYHHGDVFWIKEKWSAILDCDGDICGVHAYHATHDNVDSVKYNFSAFQGEFTGEAGNTGWMSAHSMPKWASRFKLEIDDISIGRLYDITDNEMWDEGLEEAVRSGVRGDGTSRSAYFKWWDLRNKREEFCSANNPWTWLITLENVT